MKLSRDALKQVERALEVYEHEVENTDLKLMTKHTYVLHAKNFVKWLRGDFTPGSRAAQKR